MQRYTICWHIRMVLLILVCFMISLASSSRSYATNSPVFRASFEVGALATLQSNGTMLLESIGDAGDACGIGDSGPPGPPVIIFPINSSSFINRPKTLLQSLPLLKQDAQWIAATKTEVSRSG